MKNLAIMGGMLYVAVHGAGPFSLDREDGAAGDPGKVKKKR